MNKCQMFCYKCGWFYGPILQRCYIHPKARVDGYVHHIKVVTYLEII